MVSSGPILFISFFAAVTTAQAEQVLAKDFFDFEYAKKLWIDVKTREPMKMRYDCNLNDGGVYDEWFDDFRANALKAVDALSDHPKAAHIKTCYDTHLAYDAWSKMYNAWREPLEVYGSDGWNKNTRGLSCMVIKSLNVFTGQCNDMPDWRHPKNIKEDNAWMAKGNARWLSRKK